MILVDQLNDHSFGRELYDQIVQQGFHVLPAFHGLYHLLLGRLEIGLLGFVAGLFGILLA